MFTCGSLKLFGRGVSAMILLRLGASLGRASPENLMQSAWVFRRAAWVFCTAMFLAFHFNSSAAYTNGIYAEFNTSMGSYTCRLEYASAPRTVANFISLADGQRAWLDFPSGDAKTKPFYNGLIF